MVGSGNASGGDWEYGSQKRRRLSLPLRRRSSRRRPRRRLARTPEQQLAGLIREADKFSAPRVAEASTVEHDTIAAEPPVEVTEASVRTETDALLAEAAEAITPKSAEPAEPAETDQVEEVAPGPMIAANGESWPSRESAPRRDSMLAPADVTRVAFKAQERRLETWRAAMLFMSV